MLLAAACHILIQWDSTEMVLGLESRHLEDQFLNQAFCFCPDGVLKGKKKRVSLN